MVKMTNIVSRTLRSCVKNCSSSDEITIRNAIESALDNLERASIINNYACKKIIVNKRGTIFSWEKNYFDSKKNPGDLFFDSDGKVNGLIITTRDNELFVLKNNYDFSLVSIDVQVSFQNYIDRNIHIEEPLRQL